MSSARRAARAARTTSAEQPAADWRDPAYGIPRWPPAPDNPITITAVLEARRLAREARRASQPEHQSETAAP
ncbi:hypothetical protein QFZ56_003814 [Streptomyces achromogenes]|uniref:Uncharacterized protein n=1 Tax=Streptomyces achromogenes TaxID=67255 RepID=A0ABU0Q3V1_STRAH|nr:hypothetical protein [Streptomyces achromogenes]MDQ0684851.1 hypothetical protein [Streptomyces achromogenes]